MWCGSVFQPNLDRNTFLSNHNHITIQLYIFFIDILAENSNIVGFHIKKVVKHCYCIENNCQDNR